jgi:hypothetical protein
MAYRSTLTLTEAQTQFRPAEPLIATSLCQGKMRASSELPAGGMKNPPDRAVLTLSLLANLSHVLPCAFGFTLLLLVSTGLLRTT